MPIRGGGFSTRKKNRKKEKGNQTHLLHDEAVKGGVRKGDRGSKCMRRWTGEVDGCDLPNGFTWKYTKLRLV
jgi:hypothetical protein